MGSRSGSNTRKRAATISSRVEPEIKAAVQAARGQNSESEWLRAVLIKQVGFNAGMLVPRSVLRPRQFSAPENGELGQLARSVAMATGMLKQAAQSFRAGGDQQLHADAEAALAAMSQTAMRVLEILDGTQK